MTLSMLVCFIYDDKGFGSLVFFSVVFMRIKLSLLYQGLRIWKLVIRRTGGIYQFEETCVEQGLVFSGRCYIFSLP
ncbi:MAG: hypothetical protein FD143_2927 [Ignavibacteria bacterium]|nr:MAG: hypothetical protein FD143_2927 [Ignavibacteria bacterium]